MSNDPLSNPSPTSKTEGKPTIKATRKVGGSKKRPSIKVPTGPRDSQDAHVAEPGPTRHGVTGQFKTPPFPVHDEDGTS
jgi:hypothetical protein